MSYEKQNFVDGHILYASGLNAMDDCIETVEQDVTILKSELDNFLSNNKIIEDIQTSTDEDDNTVLAIQYSTGETKTITLVGNSLNFKVVGGETEPTSPTENMIWVNTSEEITSYSFSATEPESPVEGMVWIFTDLKSSVSFNALKRNSILVRPTLVKQYVLGSFIDKEAKIFQNGSWMEMIEDEIIIPNSSVYNSDVWTKQTTVVTVDDIKTVFKVTSAVKDVAYALTPIDFTNYKKLYIKGSGTDSTSSSSVITVYVGIFNKVPSASDIGLVSGYQKSSVNNITFSIDNTYDITDITGTGYIGVCSLCASGASSNHTTTYTLEQLKLSGEKYE